MQLVIFDKLPNTEGHICSGGSRARQIRCPGQVTFTVVQVTKEQKFGYHYND